MSRSLGPWRASFRASLEAALVIGTPIPVSARPVPRKPVAPRNLMQFPIAHDPLPLPMKD